ncbi:MAG: hypothetical protein Kow00109_23980 [Acidobacteriota bacterium]
MRSGFPRRTWLLAAGTAAAAWCLLPATLGKESTASRVPWEVLAERGSGADRVVELAVGAQRRRITVRGRFAAITEVWSTTRFLLVAAELARGGRFLFVVDENRGEPVGSQPCDRYAVSPAGDRIAFTAWYPRLAPRPWAGDRVGVLAVRSAGKPGAGGAPNPGSPVALRWVYPPDATIPSAATEPRGGRLIVSPLLWTPDGDSLVFVEHREGTNYLVRLLLNPSTAVPEAVAERALQLQSLVSRPEWIGQPGGPPPDYRLVITAWEWSGPGRVRAVLYPQIWLPPAVELEVP